MSTIEEPILNMPIAQLEISEEFKRKTKQLGIQTLAELLKYQPNDLVKLPGFGYRMLAEFVSFMEIKGLGSYITP